MNLQNYLFIWLSQPTKINYLFHQSYLPSQLVSFFRFFLIIFSKNIFKKYFQNILLKKPIFHMKHHENNQPNNNTSSSPFGQCIKPKRIMPENDNIHTVYPNLTATNVLDFATKVAVQTTTKAVKTVDKNQVLANQVLNLPRSRNTSNNLETTTH